MTEFRNTPERTRLDIDLDVRHLLELLSMLPWPVRRLRGEQAQSQVHQSAADFWQEYAEQIPKRWDGDYYVEKLSIWPQAMVEPGHGADEDVRRLAEYCLMFFDQNVQDSPGRVGLLDKYLSGSGTTARRWLADVVATAWRLYAPREARSQIQSLAFEISVAGRTDLMPPEGAFRALMLHGYGDEHEI